MKTFKISEMTGGWFIGPFTPTVLNTDAFEVAVKSYLAGQKELLHVHNIAQEITVIISGKVIMCGQVVSAGEGIQLLPGEPTAFECLEDCVTVVVKTPAVIGDKYVL